MARCPYCGATIANGALPCPYCDGLTGRAPQQAPRRFCARCGEDVTGVRAAWCPGCGFRIHAVEAPPAAPAAPVRARSGGAGRFLLGLLLLAVGALLVAQAVPWVTGTLGPWGADPSIHAPAVVPTGVPGYSTHETGAGARELAYTVRGHAGTVPVTLYRVVYDAMPDRVVGYVGDDEAARYLRVIDEESGRPYIRDLAATIASMTDEPDDRARPGPTTASGTRTRRSTWNAASARTSPCCSRPCSASSASGSHSSGSTRRTTWPSGSAARPGTTTAAPGTRSSRARRRRS
ncbi:MAG: zinc ribbon domain-containing protein [Methanospirillum sp.]